GARGPAGRRRQTNRVRKPRAPRLAVSPRSRISRAVELRDLLLVLLLDRLALQLHRRRELVAAWLPLGREDLELLDLLDARHLVIGRVDLLLHRLDDLLVRGDGLEIGGIAVDAGLLEERRQVV